MDTPCVCIHENYITSRMAQIKVKKLRWGGDRSDTLLGSYVIELNANKKWKAKSHTFQWYPDNECGSRGRAKCLCQKHFDDLLKSFVEVQDDA